MSGGLVGTFVLDKRVFSPPPMSSRKSTLVSKRPNNLDR